LGYGSEETEEDKIKKTKTTSLFEFGASIDFFSIFITNHALDCTYATEKKTAKVIPYENALRQIDCWFDPNVSRVALHFITEISKEIPNFCIEYQFE